MGIDNTNDAKTILTEIKTVGKGEITRISYEKVLDCQVEKNTEDDIMTGKVLYSYDPSETKNEYGQITGTEILGDAIIVFADGNGNIIGVETLDSDALNKEYGYAIDNAESRFENTLKTELQKWYTLNQVEGQENTHLEEVEAE